MSKKKNRTSYRRQSEPEDTGSGLFLWTILIVILAGLAFICWAGSIYVFGHPERPLSYSILQKLDKIEAPKKFALKEAPKGEYFSPQKFLATFGDLEGSKKEAYNTELLRAYLRNYRETKLEVPYLTGRYKITQVFELQDSDTFPSGVVALADSISEPELSIEYILSASEENVPRIMRTLQPGLEVELQRTHELSAVTHLDRLADDRLQATVINVNYGAYTPSEGTGGFTLTPPERLNLEAGWPVIKPVVRGDLEPPAALANATPPPRPGVQTTPTQPERATAAASAAPTASPSPAATPERVAMAQPVGSPTATATPTERVARAVPVAQASPTPSSAPTPPSAERIARAEPVNSAAAEIPSGIPSEVPQIVGTAPTPSSDPSTPALKPFISASGDSRNSGGESWSTFAPGQMPRGRLIVPDDVNQLATSGLGGERYYLSGEFLVTAADRNRAIMRSQSTIASNVVNTSGSRNVRVIVDYPSGMSAPREGVVVDKDGNRAFQVTDIQRSSNGVLNVYAREVIASP